MILQGEIKPGAMISLEDIASRFGVSRVPVRDAMRILEGEALVVSMPHVGYRVARLDISELEEIIGIRRILETDAITRAAERLTEESSREMAELLERMLELERAGDMSTWVDVHRRFHFVIFDLADSSIEVRALHTLWNASDLYRSEYLQSERAREASGDQHQQLLEAVQSRDVNQVIAVMNAHRDATAARLNDSLPRVTD